METHANNKLPFPNIAFHKQHLRQPDTPNHLRSPLASSKTEHLLGVRQCLSASVTRYAKASAGLVRGIDPKHQWESLPR